MSIKKALLAASVLAAVAAVSPAAMAADETAGFKAGDILVRGRLLAVLPSISSNVSDIYGHVDASNSLEPEIDATYFFTPHVSVEAIGAITRHHLVDKDSKAGNVDLGRVTLLPPTVTAQYHFLPDQKFNPYVGAGINYTIFFDAETPSGSAAKTVQYENHFGTALQIGADYHIQGNWYANVDVKHIFLSTRAKINGGAIIAAVDVDPTVVGLGVGYKF